MLRSIGEEEVNSIKRRFGLEGTEIHAGWLLRKYPEQKKIPDFQTLNFVQRRSEVEKRRRAELFRLQRTSNRKLYQQTKKNFEKTRPYVHLTFSDRTTFVEEIARTIGGWGFARLFAECVDKIHFDPTRVTQSVVIGLDLNLFFASASVSSTNARSGVFLPTT